MLALSRAANVSVDPTALFFSRMRCSVGWPQPTEYNEAIQIPRHCFSDPELQGGLVVEDALGVPRPYSGNFADVYQVRGPGGQAWAVKCFTREVPGLQARYQAISNHLAGGSPPFMVNFRYLPEGMRVHGRWYPLLKMDWVEGFTLNEFVRKHVDKPQVMLQLARMWVKLSLQLRRARMAHADLQHGNVLLVPGEKTSQLSLRLIDYDGMYVPALARSLSGEIGHPNYQHPQRLSEALYSAEVDRFGHLVIYTALRCLIVGGRELLDKHDNGENLLFREQDFRNPQESKLLLDAWQLPDPDLRRLLGHLLIGSQMPLDQVAMLDEVVGSEGRPLGLTVAQERLVSELLPPAAARMTAAPAAISRFSLEELLAELDAQAGPGQEGPARLAGPTPQGGPGELSRTGPARLAGPTHLPVAVAELPVGAQVAKLPLAPGTSVEPNRRTAVQASGDISWRPLVGRRPSSRAMLPWLCVPCQYCRVDVHLLQAICPHCGQIAYTTLLVTGMLSLLCGPAAFSSLPNSQADLAGILGLGMGLACLVLVPLTAVLLVQALMGRQTIHPDANGGPCWPGRQVPCVRCGRIQMVPLFVCQVCGRMAWAKVAGVAAILLTVLYLVVLGEPDPAAADWWIVLWRCLRWSGRVTGLLGGVVFLAGIFQVWKLQGRLPPEGRIRTSAGSLALLAATLVPVVAVALLMYSLLPTR
jgi:hypothetical protein